MNKIIFFGNGPLAEYTLDVLAKNFEIIFHAKTKEDLEIIKALKIRNPELKGVLASFGVMIKKDVLDLFEPEGILNVHPSLLPKYRGSSPIETAILNGDTEFSVSIMKLVKAMDAGPIYYQETLMTNQIHLKTNTLTESKVSAKEVIGPKPSKDEIYKALAETGAEWIVKNLADLPEPEEQEGEPTFTEKFDKSRSALKPEEKTAEELDNEVRAFQGFPKSRYDFFGTDCIIISTHVSNTPKTELDLKCEDGNYLVIDALQPAGKKPMDTKSFLNGYKR